MEWSLITSDLLKYQSSFIWLRLRKCSIFRFPTEMCDLTNKIEMLLVRSCAPKVTVSIWNHFPSVIAHCVLRALLIQSVMPANFWSLLNHELLLPHFKCLLILRLLCCAALHCSKERERELVRKSLSYATGATPELGICIPSKIRRMKAARHSLSHLFVWNWSAAKNVE